MAEKIFTIGSLTVDIFMQPRRQEVIEKDGKKYLAVPYGEKIRVESVHELFGGGAANTAISLSRLGIDVSAVGAIGEDSWADLVIKNLEDEEVGTEYIHHIEKQKTAFSVIINSFSGERTVLVYSGATRSFEEIDQGIFHHCDGLYLCHLSGTAKLVFERVREFFKNHMEKLLCWNPGNEQFDEGIDHFADFLPVVDILLLNREEAELFTNVPAKKEGDIYTYEDIFKRILSFDFQGKIVITDGKNGSQACDGKKIFHCPSDTSGPAVDTLGAGDAFGSTFFGADLHRKSIPDALRAASVNAASVVSQFGTRPGLLSLSDIEKRINKLEVSEKNL